MKTLAHMTLLQSPATAKLKKADTDTIAKLKHYITVRKWQYTRYETIKEKLLEDNQALATRLLINQQGVVVGQNDFPVAVLYVLDELVAPYVMISKHNGKLIRMGENTVANLPNSKL